MLSLVGERTIIKIIRLQQNNLMNKKFDHSLKLLINDFYVLNIIYKNLLV